MVSFLNFPTIAKDLEDVGLLWRPEIGDEVSFRGEPSKTSILIDPSALIIAKLKEMYLWLPNTEQIVAQLEARQAVLLHAGIEMSDSKFCYRTIVRKSSINIESEAPSLRLALGLSLRDLIIASGEVH